MTLTERVYRFLVMFRHPEAIRLHRDGIDFFDYRRLNLPWLRHLGIRLVFDVGAHVGGWSRLAHAVFPAAVIYAFEPLPDCFQRLRKALPEGLSFHPLNCAIGEQNGTLEFYPCLGAHTPASSCLRMTPLHAESFPYTTAQETKPVLVPVRTLDDIARDIPTEGNVLIKIDVQGYEAKVLAGATRTLARASVVIMETSFGRLYEGQILFDEVLLRMKEAGFHYQGNLEEHRCPDGRSVQADSIFVRNDCLAAFPLV